ncbi:MAG: DUF6055 domain-containing protein [Fibrobacter sp.]|nr:DUF6055 domain-containing protein [Fibrobacter sp.]
MFGKGSFTKTAVFIGILGMAAGAATWKPVCVNAGHTLLASSEHFEICKKAKHDDGTANNATLDATTAQNALKTLEHIFSVYHDSIAWMYPQPSNANEKLKSVAYLFEDSKMGALYGGANTEGCVKNAAGKDECSPGLWLGSGAFKDLWGLAHEYAHGLQSVAGWMGSNATSGWICESHANWMAHQVNPTDAHYCSEALINFPYLYYGSTRDRYCNWQFMEHLKEEFGGGWKGVQAVNRMWMNKINDGEAGYNTQTPFDAMIGAYDWKYTDLTEQLGKFAMKNATLEYEGAKKALYKKTWGDYEFATRRTTGWGDIYRRHGRVTMLNEMPSADSQEGAAGVLVGSAAGVTYQVPSYWAPQRFGYNLVRLYPDSAGKVSVKFRGIVQESKPAAYGCKGNESYWEWSAQSNKWVQKKLCNLSPDVMPDPGSSWTVGLVAEGADGTPRYSEMKSGTAFNLEIETKADDKALWLTVTATPKDLYTITWDQFYYTIYRYPYMIRMENGKPEGYEPNAWKPAGYKAGSGDSEGTATGFKRHENGGGWVSTKANVAATVYVGPDAVVNGGTISGNARIEDFAVVNGGTIGGKAVVRGRALVTAGTMGDNAVLEDDAWLVSGSITGNAKVGALSIIVNTTVTDDAQVQGVMWAVADKKLSGTAQLRGDLENNFTKELTKGVFYGMVDDGMLNDATYGANFAEAPKEATADFSSAKWYAIDEDKVNVPETPDEPGDVTEPGETETPADSSGTLVKQIRPAVPAVLNRARYDIKGRVQNLNGPRSRRNKFYQLF